MGGFQAVTAGRSVKVSGGRRLKGEVVPIPNKNSIVSGLPAAVLTTEKVVYENVPATSDVEKILKIIELLGGEWVREGERVTIDGKGITSWKIDKELGGQFRGSLMFAGPLLARFGKAWVPVPGGCDLGFRSIAAHVAAFEKLGVKVACDSDGAYFEAPKIKEKKYQIWQLEASVTATENLAMYAAGIEAEVEVMDAAAEPHVVDILDLLEEMGARIEGKGTNRLRIAGRGKLGGGVMRPGPDFVDIAGYMTAVGVCGGRVRIKGGNIFSVVGGLVNWFRLFGIKIEEEGEDLIVSSSGVLEIEKENSGVPLAAEDLPKLAPRPWPGFPVDVIPVMATLACKTKGRLLLQNWMYESGLEFVRELNSMGADIFIADPQRIIISGPVTFKGGEVNPPAVIQAVKAIFLAALADKGETVVHGVGILRRRYPDIFETYRKLGAKIEIL